MTTFWVNEQKQIVESDQLDVRLLDYLRDGLDLTGTKCGCDDSTCGGCTVVIEGKAVRSCRVKLTQLADKKITTIEGLAAKEHLHPVQAAFVECGAIQCGFCTPALIMAVYALLEKNHNPSEAEIFNALKINLCRCGTYSRVLEATKRAAAVLRGEKLQPFIPESKYEKNEIVGRSSRRIDVIEKAKGETKFHADLNFSEMLHGKIVWGEFPHAEIVSIDIEEARNMPGVRLVLTAEDIPGVNVFGIETKDQPILAERKIRFIGEPVVAVFAEDLVTAERAANAVKVVYKELPAVFSPEEALAPNAPKVHENGNALGNISVERGDLDAAFESAEIVIEESFFTPPIEHGYLEPEGAVAIPGEGDSKVIIYNGTQNPFVDLGQLAPILALSPEEVVVRHLPIGGAFGGKCDLCITVPLTALATLITGCPTKLVLSRKESIRSSTKRHGFDMKYRLAANKDGELLGMDVKFVTDAGAYSPWSEKVMMLSAAFSTGPYQIPNLSIKAQTVFTNNPVAGAMRGYGSYQTQFAAESAMDILSRKLKIDPILLRERNALDVGRTTAVGEILTGGIAYKETLEALKPVVRDDLIRFKESGENIGIGVASGWRSVAVGSGYDENGGARLELLENGKILLKTACTEMGQGTNTALSQIVSQAVGVIIDDVDIVAGDTGVVPEGIGVSAQRGLYVFGSAAHEASNKMRNLLISESALLLGRNEADLDLIDGNIIEIEGLKKLLNLKALASAVDRQLTVEEYIALPKTYEYLPDANEGCSIDPTDYKVYHAITYCTTAVAVAVNEESGQVEVKKVYVAVDGGKVLNPEAARTQIEGAAIMGMGHALTEEFVVDQGYIKTDTLGKCRIPRISMTPGKLEVIFVENHENSGPFGSKGLAEIGILSIAPAITNAIYDATGLRVKTLPVRKQLRRTQKQ
ncbi:MAG: molybdopterin-dependent oxidoreductase [Desulfobulbaceae bacterium]|nr:molybdopterin-dependent oxidoreductase [Desulfobulbaceae bacterium]